MIINKEEGNIVLTYCNFCGTLVGSKGRFNLNVTFSNDSIKRESKCSNSSISANICPDCANRFVRSLEERMDKTDKMILDAKIKMGFDFNNLISNPQTQESETTIPETKFISLNEYSENDNSESTEYDLLECLCEMHEGVITNKYSLIKDFHDEIPSLSNLDLGDLYESVKMINIALRNNVVNYRIREIGNVWVMKQLCTQKKESVEDAIQSNMVEDDNIKIGRYTKEETQFVIDNYALLSLKQIAKKMNRSYVSVANKVSYLKEQGYIENKSNDKRRWTDEETRFLLENFESLGIKECEKRLERSEKAILLKYYNLTN